MNETQIAKNLSLVKQQIADFCIKHNKNSKVMLLAVSKTKPITDIMQAVEAGQKSFGENYIQEAVEKIDQLKHLNLDWHFIGDLQSNKTKQVAENFNWLHTLNREKIARRLNHQRPESMGKLNVCIEVNIDDEPSKFGVNAKTVFDFAEQILQFENLKLRGLMCIPKARENFAEQRLPLAKMHKLFMQLQERFPNAQIDTLSMGMSTDLEAAIAEGSSIVRVGTNIFGARNYN